MHRSGQVARDILKSATQVRQQATHKAPAWICARCRCNSEKPSSSAFLYAQRSGFSSVAPLQQSDSRKTSARPEKESILPQTFYELFPQTFPNGPPPDSPFTPDLRKLRNEFLQSQAKTHPDLVPADHKRQAEALSMRINEAYKTLQDPLRRAQYLLSLRGIDVEDESLKMQENELLMEVMEVREAVDEAEDEAEVMALRDENNERIAESCGILDNAFANGEDDVAAQEAIRLRYWTNIAESIHGWEKGKGGGAVHH